MPYSSTSELPAYVKKLPDTKQRQWMHVFNSCMKDGGDDSKCFAMANGVVKKEIADFELPPSAHGPSAEFADPQSELIAIAEKQYQYVESYDYASRQLSQQEADYNPVGGDGTEACSNCRFFISPARCAIVSGEIAPNGVSDYWQATPTYEPSPLPVIIVGNDTVTKSSSDPAGTSDAMSEGTKLQRAGMSRSSFAYVDSGGGKHLPIHDAAHVRNALARFNQTHFESDGAKKRAYRKILAAARRFGVDVSKKALGDGGPSFASRALKALGLRLNPPREKAISDLHCSVSDVLGGEALQIVKQADGQLRWFARYSNAWEDRDKELITEAAHKEYIEWADSTKNYPELWLWHTAGTRFGEADWLDFTEGFTHASGLIDDNPQAKAVVKALAAAAESGAELGVSHGFMSLQTGKYITKYRDFEVSVLPIERAAVWTTDFNVLGKETMMGFTAEKRKFLVDALGEDTVTKLEDATKGVSGQLKQLGIEYKSAEEQEQTSEKAVVAVLAEQVAELTGAVGALAQKITASEAAAATAQKAATDANAAVQEVKKSDDEKIEDAFLAKVAKAVGVLGTGVRPTASAENVVSTDGAKEASGANGSGDFLLDMTSAQIANVFSGAAAVAPGAAVAAARPAAVVSVDGQNQ